MCQAITIAERHPVVSRGLSVEGGPAAVSLQSWGEIVFQLVRSRVTAPPGVWAMSPALLFGPDAASNPEGGSASRPPAVTSDSAPATTVLMAAAKQSFQWVSVASRIARVEHPGKYHPTDDRAYVRWRQMSGGSHRRGWLQLREVGGRGHAGVGQPVVSERDLGKVLTVRRTCQTPVHMASSADTDSGIEPGTHQQQRCPRLGWQRLWVRSAIPRQEHRRRSSHQYTVVKRG